MGLKRKFTAFLLINLLVWSVVPLLRMSLSMDTYEAIVWGKFSWLGTTKHPPFSGMVAYLFYELWGETDKVMYLLSQLFAVAGIVYIYKLARQFFDETKSILAAMLQFGVIYYDYSTVEFNVNVISLALWPAAAYYFWLAYKENKWKDWLLFGLFSGFNLLNKYVGALELAAIGIFVLSDKKTRGVLFNYKAYASGIVCLLVLAPHLWWLYENNFEMLNYIAGRSGKKAASVWGHFLYPLKFIGAQILFTAAAWVSYAVFRYNAPKEKSELTAESKKFLLCLGFVPPAVFILSSFISGSALKSMWGFPMQFLLGILLIGFFPIKFDAAKAKRLFVTMAVWSMVFAFAYGVQCVLTRSERYRTDGKAFAAVMEQKWFEHTGGKPLEYAGGDVWYANLQAVYGSPQTKPMIWMRPVNNPWLDADDFARKGALIMTVDKGMYAKYEEMYPGKVTEPQRLELVFESMTGKRKSRVMYYGFYEGEGVDYDQ